jgi:hypothetical protein
LVALGLRKSRACGALGHGRFGQRDPILVGKKVTQRGGPTTSEPATRGQRREHQTARFLWPHGQAPKRNQEDGAEVVAPAPRSVLTESTRGEETVLMIRAHESETPDAMRGKRVTACACGSHRLACGPHLAAPQSGAGPCARGEEKNSNGPNVRFLAHAPFLFPFFIFSFLFSFVSNFKSRI